MVQTQKSAETRPRCNFPESRIGFSRHNQLSWTPTKRFYGRHRIFWCNSSTSPHTCLSSACQHHAEITKSHTIAALIRLSTTTHNILRFNTSEISLNNSEKLSLLPDKHLDFSFTVVLFKFADVESHGLQTSILPVFTPEKIKSWPVSKFACNFALTWFIWLLKACSRGQRLSGHLRKTNNIVP